MVLPGFLTDDWSTHLLRRHLSRLGYTVSGWGLGTNHGKLATLLPQAHAAIADLHAKSGQPVRLIGWSLGGVIAREVARRSPAHVDRVITMGSPLRGPQHTAFSAIFPTRDDRRLAERDRAQPIQVPILTLYSQRDAVVFVEGAIDDSSPAVHNHQVDCTHLGFVLSPDVYAMLAQLLQQDCSEM
jgi:alpha-beta hydrolase superfamily lysophospholipase